jgi:hypothetical protein
VGAVQFSFRIVEGVDRGLWVYVFDNSISDQVSNNNSYVEITIDCIGDSVVQVISDHLLQWNNRISNTISTFDRILSSLASQIAEANSY